MSLLPERHGTLGPSLIVFYPTIQLCWDSLRHREDPGTTSGWWASTPMSSSSTVHRTSAIRPLRRRRVN